jgi:hypothetical protein
MHLIITDAWLAKSKPLHLSGTQLVLSGLAVALALMLLAVGLYHLVFLKGAREGWPVIGTLVKLVVKDEFEQRDRFMRENIDVMAKKVGELQAKVLQLEASLSGFRSLQVSPSRPARKPCQAKAAR